MLEALSAADARRWAVLTRAAFAARRAEIDALNVYPVPDGDTGTNLYLSLDAALDAVRTDQEQTGILGAATLAQECSALARSLLLTARGNSGVIFSQLVRGFAEAIDESGAEVADARTIADGMAQASDRAYRSVTRPAEGTILTVARAAAEAGAAAVDGGLVAVTEKALDAATEALRPRRASCPRSSAPGWSTPALPGTCCSSRRWRGSCTRTRPTSVSGWSRLPTRTRCAGATTGASSGESSSRPARPVVPPPAQTSTLAVPPTR